MIRNVDEKVFARSAHAVVSFRPDPNNLLTLAKLVRPVLNLSQKSSTGWPTPHFKKNTKLRGFENMRKQEVVNSINFQNNIILDQHKNTGEMGIPWSKGGTDSDGYEKAGMVRARQKIWNQKHPSSCQNEDGGEAP